MKGYRRLTFKETVLFILDKISCFIIIPFTALGYLVWYSYNDFKSLFNKEFEIEWDKWKNEW
jgi:hypothetical protein